MEPIQCRACGAPVPVGTGIGNFTCVYCGAENCVSPEQRRRLEKYYELLRRFDRAAKEMPPFLKTIIERIRWSGLVMEGMLLLTAGWLLILSLVVAKHYLNSYREFNYVPQLHSLLGSLIPLEIFIGLIAMWGFLRLRKRILRLVFQARPPLQPGGPARCRLCGAELPDGGVVRRCNYCGADSMVTAMRFSRYKEDIAEQIEQMQRGKARNMARRIRMVDYAYSFSPIVYTGVIFGVVILSTSINMLVDAWWLHRTIGSLEGYCISYVLAGLVLAAMFVGAFIFLIPWQYRQVREQREKLKNELSTLQSE